MGFHIVLKGSVQPLSVPYLNEYNTRLPSRTPELELEKNVIYL
jgi:hypothetical protein